jgi:hypothetical protein
MLDIHDRTTHGKNLRYIKQVLSCVMFDEKKNVILLFYNLFIA